MAGKQSVETAFLLLLYNTGSQVGKFHERLSLVDSS